MIVRDITLFTNIRASFFGKLIVAVIAVLFTVSLCGIASTPINAFADEADANSGETQPADEADSQQESVYVYLRLSDDAAKTAEELGITQNDDHWFTIGAIQLDIPEAANSEQTSIRLDDEGDSDEVAALKARINEALKELVRFPANEKLAIYGAQWKELKVCNGATDYPEADGTKAWHLDGELSVQLVKFDIKYTDADGKPLTIAGGDEDQEVGLSRTLFVARGSEMAVADYAIDVPGYTYSEALTKEVNDGNLVVKAEAAATEAAALVQHEADEGDVPEQREIAEADCLTIVYEKVSSVVPEPPIVGPVDPVIPPVNPPVNPPVDPDDPSTDPVDPGDQPDDGDDPDDGDGEDPAPPSDNTGSDPENPGEGGSEQPGDAQVPVRPSNPQVNFTLPQDNRPQAEQGTANAGASDRGFASGERTAVSEPTPRLASTTAEPVAAAVDEAPVAETVAIYDDATPMVSRVGGAEAIAEEEVPMGAFDAPVDPAPWVAGLGAIGTALWGVVAVRRRLMMAQQLVAFESQVLGGIAAEADAVAVPNAGQQTS